MRRALVVLLVLAAGLAAAPLARASDECTVSEAADRVWETDEDHLAYRVGARLYGCRNGDVVHVGSATGSVW